MPVNQAFIVAGGQPACWCDHQLPVGCIRTSKTREKIDDSKLHVESMAQSDRQFSTLSMSCPWMLRDPAFSDVGTDTSTVRSGPGSFVPTRGCSSCKVALLLWERLGTVRRAAMPLPFLLHGLPHSKKLGCSRIARQESENAESRRWVWLSCAPDIASPPQARSGECCRLSPSQVLYGYGGTGGGAQDGGAKSLLDLRCGMLWVAPDYSLQASCRSAGDCRGAANC